MKKLAPALAILAVTWMSAISVRAENEGDVQDKIALLELSESLFAAVASQNPDDWRALQLADGITLSFRQDPGGVEGKQAMRLSRNEDFIAGLKHSGNEYVERWTGEPTILIRGPIAVIWGEYEFFIDGKFSHCGVDSIDAVEVEGEWKMVNIMWTVETVGCASAASALSPR